MREFGFRHLPIVDGKDLKGLVSLRDVLIHHAAEMERSSARRHRGSGLPEALRLSPPEAKAEVRYHSRCLSITSPGLGGSLKGNSKTFPSNGTRRMNSSCFFHAPIHLLSVLNSTHPLISGLPGPILRRPQTVLAHKLLQFRRVFQKRLHRLLFLLSFPDASPLPARSGDRVRRRRSALLPKSHPDRAKSARL